MAPVGWCDASAPSWRTTFQGRPDRAEFIAARGCLRRTVGEPPCKVVKHARAVGNTDPFPPSVTANGSAFIETSGLDANTVRMPWPRRCRRGSPDEVKPRSDIIPSCRWCCAVANRAGVTCFVGSCRPKRRFYRASRVA